MFNVNPAKKVLIVAAPEKIDCAAAAIRCSYNTQVIVYPSKSSQY